MFAISTRRVQPRDRRAILQRLRLAALSSIAIVLAMIPQAIHGQNRGPNPYDTMSACIDSCFSGCTGYPLGSSSRSACYDRCIQFNCKAKYVNVWGAIAYSTKEKAAGWSYEQSDQRTAENVAMRNCVKQGGAKCELATSFSKTCGSLAADGDITGWATASSKEAAQQQATTQCSKYGGKKCAVQAWVCSAAGSGATTSSNTSAPPKNPNAASWGAIAYSSRDMGAGWSQGKEDRASAEREAMAVCAKRGKECAVRGAFNKQCGALAADGAVTGVGISADQRQAQQKAMDECKNAGGRQCNLHILFCSM